jgi:hypothetical protein
VSSLVVKPVGPLSGEVRAYGAKNAVLKQMAACLLASGTHRLRNVPDIADVATMGELLVALGCRVSTPAPHELEIVVPAAGDLRLLGGFDANIRAAGDYEPTIKLMNARMNAVHVPEVMSFFYQNRTGLTQGSTRSAEEHVEIMNRYRAGLDIANVFQTEPGNPASEATGLAQLGVHAMKFSVPWEDTPVEHVDFAFECFHQALEMDPENLTAGMNVVALNY